MKNTEAGIADSIGDILHFKLANYLILDFIQAINVIYVVKQFTGDGICLPEMLISKFSRQKLSVPYSSCHDFAQPVHCKTATELNISNSQTFDLQRTVWLFHAVGQPSQTFSKKKRVIPGVFFCTCTQHTNQTTLTTCSK